jgi:hypothetical protein
MHTEFCRSNKTKSMESKKPAKTDDKLEKDLRTLVSRMKNENSALEKILVKLKSENDQPEVKTSSLKKNTNQ